MGGTGALADRTKEHLSPSDRGVIMMRQKMFEQMDVVAEGGDPKCTFRDPDANYRLRLPYPNVQTAGGGQREPRFPFLAGMPPEIEDVYRQVKATWTQEAAQPSGSRT